MKSKAMSKFSSSVCGEVKVVARTRPTVNFAHDLIRLESDEKVRSAASYVIGCSPNSEWKASSNTLHRLKYLNTQFSVILF